MLGRMKIWRIVGILSSLSLFIPCHLHITYLKFFHTLSKRSCQLYFKDEILRIVDVTYPRPRARKCWNCNVSAKVSIFTVLSTFKAEELYYTFNFMLIIWISINYFSFAYILCIMWMMHLACWAIEGKLTPQIIKTRMQNGKGIWVQRQ